MHLKKTDVKVFSRTHWKVHPPVEAVANRGVGHCWQGTGNNIIVMSHNFQTSGTPPISIF